MNSTIFTTALLLAITPAAFASEHDLNHRPKSFGYRDGFAVFVDFQSGSYDITYDLDSKSAKARAEIEFDAPEAGYPIFDSVSEPTRVLLDQTSAPAPLSKTPDGATTLRIVQRKVEIGHHHLSIEVPLTELVSFKTDGVKSAFWTSDLDERNFLERYLPSNLEFDQVRMDFTVHFKGLKSQQLIYTNGAVLRLDSETYRIQYPDHYTASSIFFHTVPAGSVDEIRFEVKSIDGRVLPAVVYAAKSSWGGSSLDRTREKVERTIRELEADYGPFPHPSITVYQAGSGGMEYCGATMSDFGSLGHELFHSYFARGVMPANGNSGWLDEAIASWRDDGYQTLTSLSGTSGMSSHPYYTRITDTAAYSFGSRFMSLLDGRSRAQGGLKPFLRHMVANHRFSPLFVEEFIGWMGAFYGTSFTEDFRRYTFGTQNRFEPNLNEFKKRLIHHKQTSSKLQDLL